MSSAPQACELLDWDTEFFGFRIARVPGDDLTEERMSGIDRWCRELGITCLYFLARSDDPVTTRVAEANDFHLVDIRITLNRSAGVHSIPRVPGTAGVLIRQASPEDADQLRLIAQNSYHESRFYYDGRFPRHVASRLYEVWIKRSCEGYADTVLVAAQKHRALGYISCHLGPDAGTGHIGLVGVDGSARGRGLGQELVFSALDWFAAHGANEVLVVTQGRNFPAQRLYQRCGFLTKTVQLWYHKWY